MKSIFRMTVESWFLVNVHLFISGERRRSSMTVMRVSWKAFYDLTVPILFPASLTARLAGLLTMQSLFTIFSGITRPHATATLTLRARTG